MKRGSRRQSTIHTPSPHIFDVGGRGFALALGVASSTAITLPVATAELHHEGIAGGLLAGLFPGLPLLLVTAVLLFVHLVVSSLAVVVTIICLAFNRDIPVDTLRFLFAVITNALIAFMTRTPLKLAKREGKASSQGYLPMSLPAGAPGDARNQGTPSSSSLNVKSPNLSIDQFPVNMPGQR